MEAPTDYTRDELAAALREGAARADHTKRGAVDALIAYNGGELLDEPDVRRCVIADHDGTVRVTWRGLADDLDAGVFDSVSSTAYYCLCIAVALGDGRVMPAVHAALSDSNRRAVLDAFAVALGQHRPSDTTAHLQRLADQLAERAAINPRADKAALLIHTIIEGNATLPEQVAAAFPRPLGGVTVPWQARPGQAVNGRYIPFHHPVGGLETLLGDAMARMIGDKVVSQYADLTRLVTEAVAARTTAGITRDDIVAYVHASHLGPSVPDVEIASEMVRQCGGNPPTLVYDMLTGLYYVPEQAPQYPPAAPDVN